MEQKCKIMIVDDAALMRMVIKKLLQEDKRLIICAMAQNGAEALKLLSEHSPDVILLDLEMPQMDGLTFLRHARDKTEAKIIVLSSRISAGDTAAAEAVRLGADSTVPKPSGSVSFDLKQKVGKRLLNTIYEQVGWDLSP